jgi:hypothetical protein
MSNKRGVNLNIINTVAKALKQLLLLHYYDHVFSIAFVSFQAASSSEKRTLAISGSGPESPSESSSPSDSSSSSSSSSFTSFVAGEALSASSSSASSSTSGMSSSVSGLNSQKEYRQDDAPC